MTGLYGRRFDAMAILFLFSLSLALLSREILFGGSILDGDIELMSVPAYSWFADHLKQGTLPLWSPEVMGGAPIAFAIYTFLYPPDILLARLLDGARAFHLSLALHVALAGACSYWYCRVLGMRRLPALLAGVLFEMGNQVLAWQSNGFVSRTFYVLPALLATTELAFNRRAVYWLLVPIIVGAGLLGGYAQVVLMSLAATGFYALIAAWKRRNGLGGRGTLGRLALLAIGVALGFGLAALRVVPTLAVTAASTRGSGMDLAHSAVDSIEPLSLLVGHLFPPGLEIRGDDVNRPDYVGVPALLLAAFAVARFGRLEWNRRFHIGLATVATVLSMGQFTPFYGWLLGLPFFSLFRGPDRISPIAGLAIAVLAAHALDRHLLSSLSPRGRITAGFRATSWLLAILGLLALLVSLSFQFGQDPLSLSLRETVVARGMEVLSVIRPRVAIAFVAPLAALIAFSAYAHRRIGHRALELLVLALSAVTLFSMGWAQNQWVPPAELHEPPAFLKVLKADNERYRVFSWVPGFRTYDITLLLQANGLRAISKRAEERYNRQFIPPNLGMLFGVSTIEWYDALQSRRQALVAKHIGSERAELARYSNGDWVDWSQNSRGLPDRLNLLATLNVKYLTTGTPIDDPRLELVDAVRRPIDEQFPVMSQVLLYRLKESVPRAFLVPEARVIPGEEDALHAVQNRAVNPLEAVVLEREPPALEEPLLTAHGSTLEMLSYDTERVTMRAQTDGSGFLVLTDFLLPGWTATVDGQPEPILAANFAGRAVPLRNAGQHRVEFVYQPPLFREGLIVSAVSVVILGLIAFASLRPIPLLSWRRRSSRVPSVES